MNVANYLQTLFFGTRKPLLLQGLFLTTEWE